ncbi:hypothetical protein EV200_109137 [Pedobacter psychrotolerans]|uniref:Uncharacterized protein n=1 Tax=Pedobacter psychrotolerans TaxID=1843235 RepID=A0A4R2H477_9SPHI|nr:hypothetical protein EV200_109137 [Pedobacter psychrotolerans]
MKSDFSGKLKLVRGDGYANLDPTKFIYIMET